MSCPNACQTADDTEQQIGSGEEAATTGEKLIGFQRKGGKGGEAAAKPCFPKQHPAGRDRLPTEGKSGEKADEQRPKEIGQQSQQGKGQATGQETDEITQ